MSIADYSTTPDNNTLISGINIAEGCPASGINDAIRQMMADIKTEANDTVHKTGAETISGAKTFTAAITASGGVTGNVTGNAGTATALQTARTINGVSFDGTSNITVDDSTKVALDGSNTASIGSTLSTYMANASMPSSQYIDMTLPASGGTFTPPADGWLCFEKYTNGNDQWIALYSNTNGLQKQDGWPYAAWFLSVFIPVRKNESVTVSYTASGTLLLYRFVYANGSIPA